ncbi:hypothetical protein SADUNF_Sadunf06G0177900 [Salix dunnii]|uniref:Uncharacterized protein n=1 Tax=Salix dunnii TaxID=1413687 RepID=A0A835N374_9ROSI|nr:hypothetical protein SADUNF_Sadunf06G0177900 [Salix dunnii]
MVKMSDPAFVLAKIDWLRRFASWEKMQNLPNQLLSLWLQWIISFVKTLKSRGEEYLKRMDQYLASIKLIMEPANGKDQAVKWTARLLENILHCNCRTPWIEQWRRVDGCSFPIFEKIKDSKLLFSRKYYVGRGGAVTLFVKVNKAFMI